MKVYVDELPKGCESCPFYLKEHCVIDSISFLCPLEEKKIQIHSLSDYTKQVRKEVCDCIRDKLSPYFDDKDEEYIKTDDLEHILDQIQGETNERKTL